MGAADDPRNQIQQQGAQVPRTLPLAAQALRAAQGQAAPRPTAAAVAPQPPTAPSGGQETPFESLSGRNYSKSSFGSTGAYQAPQSVIDPLSRPLTYPSRGMFYGAYGNPSGVQIVPTRGEQEEVLAGASGNPAARLPILRGLTKQCFNTGALPFEEMLLDDWMYTLLHFLSYSAGSDVLGLRPTCTAVTCKKSFPYSLALTKLPCRVLRTCAQGEVPTWPIRSVEDENPEIAVLRRLIARDEEMDRGITEMLLTTELAQEPYRTKALEGVGDVVEWRFLRMKDVELADEYSTQMETIQTGPGSKMNNLMLASHIVTLNGNPIGLVEAYEWVKANPTFTNNDFKTEINARTIGYEMAPMFKCPHCGNRFKARLPLDGGLFRH